MSVFDVASYILSRTGPISGMKLQKLVYYSQAWALAWTDQPIFDEPLEAWAGGPVCRPLYSRHRLAFPVTQEMIGSTQPLETIQQSVVDTVLEFYGQHTAQWLSDLTHLEAPWQTARARAGAAPGDSCTEVITLAEIHEYYSGLMQNDATTQAVS